MKRIKSLQLNNFKFFQEERPIELNGNNLLLYGENGSGKSSIYWALYTLFEASLKKEDDIRKYFCKTIKVEDNLINIHAKENPTGSDDFNSFVEIVTTDVPEKRYKISKNDVAINVNTDARFTNYASDFINYRMLLGISAFRHSWKIDLFNVFVEDIFKYVQFAKVKITRHGVLKEFTNAFEIWREIEQGHEIVDSVRSAKPRKIRAYKNSNEWKEFESFVKSFNESLKKLIDYINIQAPIYFQKLGYQFSFYLELEKEAYYTKGETTYEHIPFVLRINIPEYEKEKNALYKPHSFLNEAKLSALAISIRLAILSEKRQENCLKFIVLDDLLISLDMSNRERVLELLLSAEFVDNYQLIILTHDRMFYQMAKHKIDLLEQDNWVLYELFEKVTDDISSPVIQQHKNYFAKATEFYAANQLEESANNLRKAAEAFCKKFLSKTDTITEDYSNLDLNGMLVKCKNYSIANELEEQPFKELDKHRKFILNSSSHDDIDTPKFKTELDSCIKLFEQYFNLVKIKNVLAIGTKVHFELTDAKTAVHFRFDIVLNESFKLYKYDNNESVLVKGKTAYTISENGAPNAAIQYKYQSLKTFYDYTYSKSDKTKTADFWEGVIISETGLPISSIRKF
jgi:hypothetical protein